MSFGKPSELTDWSSDKRVRNIVTSQCHLILSPFFVSSSEWATLEAHNFNTIMNFEKILKVSTSAHQNLYFKTRK